MFILVRVMAALALAALLGYAWMGEGGAAAFVLAGLWGNYGSARPWAMGRGHVGALIAAVTLAPAALWALVLLRPVLAIELDGALAGTVERMLDYTMADGRAYHVLAEHGRMDQFAALRLGVAACWLSALPAAAAIVLWYGVKPVEKWWHRDGERFDPMTLLFGGMAMLVLSTALLMSGFGFGPGRGSFALGPGMLFYPGLFAVWLGSIAGLRSWANWWFAPRAPGRAPIL